MKTHETAVKQSDSEGNVPGLESSIAPGELYMNTNSLLILLYTNIFVL